MLINSGTLKGFKLASPKGSGTRPTSAKIRDAVLNRFQGQLAGARILDLYAGTGAIGLTALSRGAGIVAFCENDRQALAALQRNCDAARGRYEKQGLAAPNLYIHSATVERTLQNLQREHLSGFDLIWLDPPYAVWPTPEGARVLELCARLLADDGVIVAESSDNLPPPTIAELAIQDVRRYGNTLLTTLARLR